jgi:tryptophanyl-tRNA synthetase
MQPLLTENPYIPGFDGRKMSKSYDNAIFIDDDEETTEQKIKKYITDPQKIYKNSPGRPEICNVFLLHKSFKNEDVSTIEQDCKSGRLGCVECKKNLAKKINDTLREVREKRREISKNKSFLLEILVEGSKKAKQKAREKLDQVNEKMKLTRGVRI